MAINIIPHTFGILMTLFLSWAFGAMSNAIPALAGLFMTILVILLLELTWNITKIIGHTK